MPLKACGVDYGVRHALADEKTVEPTPLPAGFVATHHPGLLRPAKAVLGPTYLLQDW
jgi:hypothetical protein